MSVITDRWVEFEGKKGAAVGGLCAECAMTYRCERFEKYQVGELSVEGQCEVALQIADTVEGDLRHRSDWRAAGGEP
jgi:hypothetical protein